MTGVSSRLSLTPNPTPWSSIKAQLGPLAGIIVEVTQKGWLQNPCVVQKGGRAGATTLSKFSAKTMLQGVGVAEGVGVPEGDGVIVGVGVVPVQLP